MEVVYLIATVDRKRVKIGLSRNPRRRLRQLQTGHSDRLEILDLVPGGRKLEAFLHSSLSDFRMQGEWFTVEEGFFDHLQIAYRTFLGCQEWETQGGVVNWNRALP